MIRPDIEQMSITSTPDGVMIYTSPGCKVDKANETVMKIAVHGMVVTIHQVSSHPVMGQELRMLVPNPKLYD